MSTVQAVCEWLEATIDAGGIGLVTADQKQRILSAARENQIDGEALESLDEADFELLLAVGVFGQRRKLMLRINELVAGSRSAEGSEEEVDLGEK
jgi:hypothetical protein